VNLVDANILLYAHFGRYTRHKRARAWLKSQLDGPEPVGLPWPSILAFLRVATNPHVFPNPISTLDAWDQVREWLSSETAWIPQPTEHHADVLAELLLQPGVTGKLIMDAHLAALAIEHGLTLYSADTDFARFRTLKWVNPLG
jgi:toxin-antitoxin system PIN domain toxin